MISFEAYTSTLELDGRIISSVKETEYINNLKNNLSKLHPSLHFEYQPKPRWWWDFRLNGIPFNLKLTTGGTDNVFNKVAIIYSITGIEVTKRNMNFNQFIDLLKRTPKKTSRQRDTEYHYLVVNKLTNTTMIRSILDIQTFISNPCNYLQVHWNKEFRVELLSTDMNTQIHNLLSAIQMSVRRCIENMQKFATVDLEFIKE